MKTFVLPDLGEGLPEAEIVAWRVNAGDRVVEDQPLVTSRPTRRSSTSRRRGPGMSWS